MLFNKEETYDFYDYSKNNNLREFQKMVVGCDIPDHIKEGHDKSIDPSKLNDNCFSLIVKEGGEIYRRFPVNNFSETWFSKLAFINNYEKLPFICRDKVAYSIKHACDHFGIFVEDAIGSMAKHASSLEGYSINVVDFDNNHVRDLEMSSEVKLASDVRYALEYDERYPLNTPLEIKTAMEFFERNKSKLEAAGMAEEFAENTKIAGDIFSIACNDSINATLSLNEKVPHGYIDIHLENRIKKACEHVSQVEGKSVWSDILMDMGNLKDNAPYMPFDKVSSELTKIDRRLGIDAYRGNILNPKDIFNKEAMEKKAYGTTSTKLVINKNIEGEKDSTMGSAPGHIKKDDLEGLERRIKEDNNMIKGHFNSETTQGLINDFKKTYSTLDKLDKEILDKLNNENMGS